MYIKQLFHDLIEPALCILDRIPHPKCVLFGHDFYLRETIGNSQKGIYLYRCSRCSDCMWMKYEVGKIFNWYSSDPVGESIREEQEQDDG